MSSKRKGWVYVFSNPSIPDQVKIGFTFNNVEQRRSDLYNTGNPTPFKTEYEILVINPQKVERKAHQILKKFRTNKNREFFSCTPNEAVDAIKQAITSLEMTILHEEEFFVKPQNLIVKKENKTKQENTNQNEILRGKYSNGVLKYEVELVNGLKQGIEKGFSENGKLEYETYYSKGMKSGLEKHYCEVGGNCIFSVSWRDNIKHGVYKEFHSNGEYCVVANYRNGALDGKYRRYWENGHRAEYIDYVDGVIHGERELFWSNGEREAILPMVNGVIHGMAYFQSEDGNSYEEVEFINGEDQRETTLEKGIKIVKKWLQN